MPRPSWPRLCSGRAGLGPSVSLAQGEAQGKAYRKGGKAGSVEGGKAWARVSCDYCQGLVLEEGSRRGGPWNHRGPPPDLSVGEPPDPGCPETGVKGSGPSATAPGLARQEATRSEVKTSCALPSISPQPAARVRALNQAYPRKGQPLVPEVRRGQLANIPFHASSGRQGAGTRGRGRTRCCLLRGGAHKALAPMSKSPSADA